MKEKVIFISVLVLLLIVLCIPIPKGTIEDGGSKVYHAVLYKPGLRHPSKPRLKPILFPLFCVDGT